MNVQPINNMSRLFQYLSAEICKQTNYYCALFLIICEAASPNQLHVDKFQNDFCAYLKTLIT